MRRYLEKKEVLRKLKSLKMVLVGIELFFSILLLSNVVNFIRLTLFATLFITFSGILNGIVLTNLQRLDKHTALGFSDKKEINCPLIGFILLIVSSIVLMTFFYLNKVGLVFIFLGLFSLFSGVIKNRRLR